MSSVVGAINFLAAGIVARAAGLAAGKARGGLGALGLPMKREPTERVRGRLSSRDRQKSPSLR
ncbi:MAG: hypothetical protein LBJ61_05590 [Deltaproteobacteria bacterium]|nr:hypothetical protein [Deltaproteobacteria bacterium]